MKGKMGWISDLLGRFTLKTKILLIFVLCVLTPMLFQFFTFYNGTLRSTEDLMHQQMVNSAERVRSDLNSTLNDTVQLLVRFYSDSRLYDFMNRDYETDLSYLIAYQNVILPIMNFEIPFHPQLERVCFFTDNPTLFAGAFVRPMADSEDVVADIELAYRSTLMLNNYQSVTLYIGNRLSLGKHIRFMTLTSGMTYFGGKNAYRKLLRMDINMSDIAASLQAGLFENQLLTDGEGHILCSSREAAYGEDYRVFDPGDLPQGARLISLPLQGLPFTLHSWYDGDLLYDEFVHTMWHSAAYSILGILLALVFMLLLGGELSARISRIIRHADRIAQGDFSDRHRLTARRRHDEVAQIEQRIDALSSQLQAYIDNEYSAKVRQADLEKDVTQAKLQALQSQVNPHFLFNALESIRLNALDRDRTETAKMIKYMARMFRYLVDWEGDFVRLEQELDFLNEYLVIQKYRFGEDFQYQIEVASEALHCMVPKLILQPMVENACVHGVESQSGIKRIAIEVTLEIASLCMKVSDSGCGFEKEKLEALRQSLTGACPSGSVGLYNVYQRLRLIYGTSFSFDIESERGHGTVCLVRIPAQRTLPDGIGKGAAAHVSYPAG